MTGRIYRCWADVRIYLGPIEANSEEEAEEIADMNPTVWPQGDYEVKQIIAEEE